MQACRADLSIFAVLAESEAWVLPHDSESHPVALTFYVPAHLADELIRQTSFRGAGQADQLLLRPAVLRLEH
jgi:hypothetical protein